MPPKVYDYAQLAEQVAVGLTKSYEGWTNFLNTASRLYKYSYADQLLIYAQRPDATACASYDLWNSAMRRYVRRGAKGIALLDTSGDYPRLRYVFDVSDTGIRDDSRDPYLWQLEDRHQTPVSQMLSEEYALSPSPSFSDTLEQTANALVQSYWREHERDILGIVDGSFLEEYDDLNVSAAFRSAATASVAYTLQARCGVAREERIPKDGFAKLYDWNTPDAVAALGTAVSACSEQALRQIERTVKTIDRERSEEHDRTELHEERRLPDPQPDDRAAGDETAGQVREDAQSIPEGTPPNPVQPPAPKRDAERAPDGDRRDGAEATGADDERAGGGERRDGEPESLRPDEVGRPDEHPESAGRGTRADGAGVQLNFFGADEQVSLFPSEAQQISFIEEAESGKPFASSISQEDIDHILRLGGNSDGFRETIISDFSKSKPLDVLADRLSRLMHGGNGLVTENGKISVWYDPESGIRIARGASARYALTAQTVSWRDAAARIQQLLEDGRYATNVEIAEAPGYTLHKTASALQLLYMDITDDAAAKYLPSITRGGGYDEGVERIEALLRTPETRSVLQDEFTAFAEAYRQDRGLMRYHFHDVNRIAQEIAELSMATRDYTSEMVAVPSADRFITQDEIDEALAYGSGVSNGKERILSYFSEAHAAKEKADFLKREYGIGGRSHALSRATGSNESHDGKGIRYSKQDCPDIALTWNAAARRIDELIRQDRYLSAEERAQREAAQETSPDAVRDIPEAETPQETSTLPEVQPPQKEAPEIPAAEQSPVQPQQILTQDDIDDAIRAWNGNMDSKRAVVRYMTDHAREKETADWLKNEYGDQLPAFPVTTAHGATDLPWPRVQRRIAKLIREDRFFSDAEQDRFDNIDPIALREALIERGVMGEKDAEAQADSPFIRQVMADVEEIAQEDREQTEPADHDALPPPAAGENPRYQVGDTVYLEDTRFEITEVGALDVQLRDPSLAYPIFRAESRERFDRLIRLDERNAHLWQEPEKATEKAPEIVSEPVAVYPAEKNRLPFDVVVERLHVEPPERAEPPQPEPQNFRITDDHLGEGGAKTKYGYNIAAIRTLKQIEAEERFTTPEEQEVLSRYVGWGGIPQAFDARNESWHDEYEELKALLTPEEYDKARASTLNAHYTSPTVIKAIYEAVGSMGFKTGNILEPSMGIGNFFGLLPESMKDSRLYGVELDSITGRIAQQLYPKADITVAGFETTNRKDFYDLAIGNIPFGAYKLPDRQFDRYNFLIHDYFFAKALDQVRPGGVIAFITSKGTMDKRSPDVRRYIAQRAELLSAIRLPNNAFKANANTEVTTDILFLQKRDRPIDIEPDWVHLGRTEDGIPINSYFVEHPEMVLGRIAWDDSMYGNEKETACLPIEGEELAAQLAEAVKHIEGQYAQADLSDIAEDNEIGDTIPADPNVKNYSYAVIDGEVYYRENSVMARPELSATAKERVKGLVALRDCTQRLIDAQLSDESDTRIGELQKELNTLYDGFTAKYGLINSRANNSVFSSDSSYYLLCSLEVLNEKGELERKADMFSECTILRRQPVERVDTAVEALAVSIGERAGVDLGFMASLMGGSEKIPQIVSDLQGVIFKDPASGPFDFSQGGDRWARGWQTSDEYLSGNVREKLKAARTAAETDAFFDANVKALEAIQPKDLEASEIDVRLGAVWIDPLYVQQFMHELLETPYQYQRKIAVAFSEHTAEWNVSNKSLCAGTVQARFTYGTDRVSAYKIIEDTLNLRDTRVFDTVLGVDGSEHRVLNVKETTLAQQKQQAIKAAFQEWIWQDANRRHRLVTIYNERFNARRPREYDGRHIMFSGMNPEITLREHQRNAIAHILYGGNTLLAHEVGAGKTFEMVASAMESKRLGLCQKSMFVVPNHLTEQWASEFLRLYPSANILITTKKDFEKANRKKFCARIATGDYDAIIIGHSQFERIPISQERQERLLREQIADITEGIEEIKGQHGEPFTIKQLERTKKQLEARLQKLIEVKKDDVVTFEQLGVDRLYVDEAHAYKNLFLYTKMRNVAGLSTSEAQKSTDMFLKCRYMDELTGGKGVVFATGTPVSNSMTELYTMQRYLQYGALERAGMTHFDCWASTFGETVTAIELAPEGTGYRARTRFAKFFNLPELMAMFKEVADIKVADQLNLLKPDVHYETVVTEPSEYQQEMVQSLSERASKVHAGSVDPSVDNMLKITSDGRKLGLDQRLINPMLPDNPDSKVNACVGNIFRIWKEGERDKLTQLVFCDLSTPRGKSPALTEAPELAAKAPPAEINGGELPDTPVADLDAFNVYDDLREKLVAQGIPREEIAYIHEANSEAQKKELFAKVRSGRVRVLIGSTAKMGAGTNVQDRLVALHDLDCPWRPGDLEQRAGRIVRQGNMNSTVNIYRYVTNATFDAYLWQTVENKQKFIGQIMTSKSPVRSCEDVDDTALSYAEIKALCAGDPHIKEKMDLDVEVARLRLMKADHQSKKYRLEDQLASVFPVEIKQNHEFIDGFRKDLETLAAHPLPEDKKVFIGMEIKGDLLTDKDNAGAAILEACKDRERKNGAVIGHYRGFEMSLDYDPFGQKFLLTLRGEMSHRVELGSDARGNLIRIENALNAIPDRIKAVEARLDTLMKRKRIINAR